MFGQNHSTVLTHRLVGSQACKSLLPSTMTTPTFWGPTSKVSTHRLLAFPLFLTLQMLLLLHFTIRASMRYGLTSRTDHHTQSLFFAVLKVMGVVSTSLLGWKKSICRPTGMALTL